MTQHTHPPLLPCPFCGAGTTEIRENGKIWTGMKFSDPVSVSVRHWCEPIEGQPSRAIERVGRDRASAIAAWNARAPADAVRAQALEEAACLCDQLWTRAGDADQCADAIRALAHPTKQGDSNAG